MSDSESDCEEVLSSAATATAAASDSASDPKPAAAAAAEDEDEEFEDAAEGEPAGGSGALYTRPPAAPPPWHMCEAPPHASAFLRSLLPEADTEASNSQLAGLESELTDIEKQLLGMEATVPMQQTWTVPHHDGPDHLGLWREVLPRAPNRTNHLGFRPRSSSRTASRPPTCSGRS